MWFEDIDGNIFKPTIQSASFRTEWEGDITLNKPGYYTANLEYVDGGEGTKYTERHAIRVEDYYGTEYNYIKAESGCNILGYPVFAAGILLALSVWGRMRQQ